MGSPPHTWRTRSSRLSSVSFKGITSTYVENTKRRPVCSQCDRDHLHIRGEHRIVTTVVATSCRITSTYVENTKSFGTCLWVARDHLHIRGEHLPDISTVATVIGSPPHTWRTLNLVHGSTPQWRITSTYVENTQPSGALAILP